MKKLSVGIIAIIAIIAALLFTTAAVAIETVTEQGSSKQIDVQAKAVYISPENMYSSVVTDGKLSIRLQNGAMISVSASGTELDGLTMNVIELVSEDAEAFAWISDAMEGICDRFTAYDICFVDADGNRVEVTGEVTVTVTTPDGYADIQVYHIDSNGVKTKVTSTQSGGNTVFVAAGFSYYVLADAATEPDVSETSDSPETGDAGNMPLWVALMLVSGMALATLWLAMKRRRASKS